MNLTQEEFRGTGHLGFCRAGLKVEDRVDEDILVALHQRWNVLATHGCHVNVFVVLLLNFVIAIISSTCLVVGAGFFLHTQVHLPAGPLCLILGQVVPLDVGLAMHHNVLRLGRME